MIYKRVDFDLVYGSTINQKQIRFTRQKVVPVLEIDSEWRLDSTPLCLWLEELSPSPGFAGSNAQEERAIKDADQWLTRNLIVRYPGDTSLLRSHGGCDARNLRTAFGAGK